MLWNRMAVVAALAIGTVASPALAETLRLVGDESKIEFVGRKTDGKHEGGFKKFAAKADANFEEPSESKLVMEIDAGSLWSDNSKLTNHLKNPDFFDVRKYPEIRFESTKVIPGKEGAATLVGQMKMLGKTVEVTIPVTSKVSEEQVVLEAEFSLDRTKWGMDYGSGKIDKEVSVKAHLVFAR